jgi:Leucine-rich repeat (LRR) protein
LNNLPPEILERIGKHLSMGDISRNGSVSKNNVAQHLKHGYQRLQLGEEALVVNMEKIEKGEPVDLKELAWFLKDMEKSVPVKLKISGLNKENIHELLAVLTETENVQYLDLSNNDLIGAIQALAECQALKNLKTLILGVWSLRDDGDARDLATMNVFENLEELDINGNQISPVGLRAIIGPESLLKNLRVLDLSYSFVNGDGDGDEAATIIATELDLPNLIELYLDGNRIQNDGAKALGLGKAGALKKLKRLYLSSNKINGDGVMDLVGPKSPLENLELLSLSSNPLGEKGITVLVRYLALKKLTALYLADTGYLAGTGIGDSNVKILKNPRAFPNSKIKKLDLSNNKLTNIGAKDLSEAKFLKNLDVLLLDRNLIGDKGAMALAESKSKSGILSLSGNYDVTEGVRNDLKKKYGNSIKFEY